MCMYIYAHTLYLTGPRQKTQQSCKHSTNSLILFLSPAHRDEPVVLWIPLGSEISYPVAGLTIWSLNWCPQLLAPGYGSLRPAAPFQW